MAPPQERKNIVIIGGGIIGSTCAYFLSHHPKFNPATTTITLLEASKIAGGASGKAGGLLGLWAYPQSIVPLSFRLHKELADKHGGAEKWGYRPCHVASVMCKGRADVKARDTKESGYDKLESLPKRDGKAMDMLRKAGVPEDLDWLRPEGVLDFDAMGDTSNSAQVHPYYFTTSIAKLAEEKGVKIILGSVTGLNTKAGEDNVESVTYQAKEDGQEHTIPADTVVVSAGPWTQNVLPKAPIDSIRAHSVTIKPTRPVSAYALFTSIALPPNPPRRKRAEHVDPEIYARPNQEVYACGKADRVAPLPSTSDEVEVDNERCEEIVEHVNSISDELANGDVTARQACYLPQVSAGSGPLIGEVPGWDKSVFLAAGHTCWGIQNGPGTGKLISELVWDGKTTSARLGGLDPKNVM